MRRPTSSMAVALLALFIALGGTATAASVLITSSKQVRNGTITGADLKDGTVGVGELTGAARAAMAGTAAVEATRAVGPVGVAKGASERVATLQVVEAGRYAIFAKTVLTGTQNDSKLFNTGDSIGGHCTLDAAGDTDQSRALLGAPGANSPGQLNMQITRTLQAGDRVTLTCDVVDAVWRASNTSVMALKLTDVQRQSVDG